MGRSITSSSKRKGGKLHPRGGLGGPGGRGGRRKSLRAVRGGVSAELPADLLRLDAREMATTMKGRTSGENGATAYRTAMSALTSYANEHSKTMKPELRAKLARAKDHLRDLFGIEHDGKGKGGPGAKREKPKAKSRRNPRPTRIPRSARGGSHRASTK